MRKRIVRAWALRLLAPMLLAAPVPLAAQTADESDADVSAYHQAFLNYKAGNYAAALVAVQDAEKEQPGKPAVAILKGRILTELGEFDDARKALETLNGDANLTPAEGDSRTLAFADLCLRRRSFDEAAKFYQSLLQRKPDDPDLILKLVYSRVGAGDLVDALTYASKLKPLDPINPDYYFAKAAIADAGNDSVEADEDIQTARTIYGITAANRYLKTYLALFSNPGKNSVNARLLPPSTNAPPPAPGQP
jgi:Flp pilus assembly protein TadD